MTDDAMIEAAEVASDQLDELFALHRTEIVRLKSDLAEARAQSTANIKQAGKHFAETCRLEHELAEARAQIAAKDAALRDFGVRVEAFNPAAPAREDEPLSDEDQRLIDKAWENYQKAAATKPARGTGE